MKLGELLESWDKDELTVKQKAGLIPWVREAGGIKMLFVISSNSAFAGPYPGIIKGSLNKGESPKQAALREGEEEVGLTVDQFIGLYKLPKRSVRGELAKYKLTVFAAELEARPRLKLDKAEVGEAVWLTLEEFQRVGRRSHEPFVNNLVRWAQ